MRTSINFLPERKQRDLQQITAIIRREVKDVVMIILYGSYARNTFVDFDETCEFGVREVYQSDYDILIVTKKRLGTREGTIRTLVTDRFMEGRNILFQTYPQIIGESIGKLNKALSEGRYFYVDIISDGIMLYDSGEYTLATPHELNFSEIKQQALDYYHRSFYNATDFLEGVRFYYDRENYRIASFILHQSSEHFLKTIPLIFILYGPKEHDLDLLMDRCKPYTLELAKIFPCDTEEEKHLFDLLKRAYIEGRYNPHFEVTRDDLDKLIPKVTLLHDLVEDLCRHRFEYYDKQIENV